MCNDGWWPDIDMVHLRGAMRVPPGVTDGRLVESTIIAIDDVNNELAKWKDERIAEGHNSMQDVPAATLNEENVLLVRYRRAVYNVVDADLIEQHINVDTTATGEKRAEDLLERKATARRNKRWAITAILKYQQKKHCKIYVELI